MFNQSHLEALHQSQLAEPDSAVSGCCGLGLAGVGEDKVRLSCF